MVVRFTETTEMADNVYTIYKNGATQPHTYMIHLILMGNKKMYMVPN